MEVDPTTYLIPVKNFFLQLIYLLRVGDNFSSSPSIATVPDNSPCNDKVLLFFFLYFSV